MQINPNPNFNNSNDHTFSSRSSDKKEGKEKSSITPVKDSETTNNRRAQYKVFSDKSGKKLTTLRSPRNEEPSEAAIQQIIPGSGEEKTELERTEFPLAQSQADVRVLSTSSGPQKPERFTASAPTQKGKKTEDSVVVLAKSREGTPPLAGQKSRSNRESSGSRRTYEEGGSSSHTSSDPKSEGSEKSERGDQDVQIKRKPTRRGGTPNIPKLFLENTGEEKEKEEKKPLSAREGRRPPERKSTSRKGSFLTGSPRGGANFALPPVSPAVKWKVREAGQKIKNVLDGEKEGKLRRGNTKRSSYDDLHGLFTSGKKKETLPIHISQAIREVQVVLAQSFKTKFISYEEKIEKIEKFPQDHAEVLKFVRLCQKVDKHLFLEDTLEQSEKFSSFMKDLKSILIYFKTEKKEEWINLFKDVEKECQRLLLVFQCIEAGLWDFFVSVFPFIQEIKGAPKGVKICNSPAFLENDPDFIADLEKILEESRNKTPNDFKDPQLFIFESLATSIVKDGFNARKGKEGNLEKIIHVALLEGGRPEDITLGALLDKLERTLFGTEVRMSFIHKLIKEAVEEKGRDFSFLVVALKILLKWMKEESLDFLMTHINRAEAEKGLISKANTEREREKTQNPSGEKEMITKVMED